MDEFHVCALYDEKGVPFYIGKDRVNSHTKPSNLRIKSYKNNKVKLILREHRQLKREILTYCNSENS
jgi:hypothetical protein